ncbi:hypothetical protein FAZ19_09180 [Sphingobacterium alkalisoli]|uniref:Uncharacterized protein n=1 Tax=Sphingobacterium alkalisoli TaxID=1874115 RepID=A0A4U0H5N4_9SPHI|nr:Pr6Pr family membrane protein [Sphingobacterium alkalisoli]TJY67055.1 hypothetical protein FAZ19_09180 [Sphingobacterium alkalisoli]
MTKTELPHNIKWINATILMVMALLTIYAVTPWNAWKVDSSSPSYGWNRFSFFTVQSNFIAAATYLIASLAIVRKKRLGEWFRYLRGAAVLYMMVTGIVYALLLQDTEVNPTPGYFNWSNFMLHQFGPFFITVWWLLWPSRLAVTSRGSLRWLIFPILWLIYTFIRASFTGWYPYPFLNPDKTGGTTGVNLYVLAITVFFLILSQLLAWISRARANNHTLY